MFVICMDENFEILMISIKIGLNIYMYDKNPKQITYIWKLYLSYFFRFKIMIIFVGFLKMKAKDKNGLMQ